MYTLCQKNLFIVICTDHTSKLYFQPTVSLISTRVAPHMASHQEKTYTAVVNQLTAKKKTMLCREVRTALETLKFKVTPKGSAGHRAYKHPEIPSFFGGSYDCGHGSNGQVKPVYIQKILGVLDEYQDAIISYL